MSTEVLSVRVKRELRREAERLGINIKKVIEEALMKAIEEAKRRKLEKALEEILKLMENVSEEEWAKVVRECRRGR
ncbi:DUF4145 domain-containing protein [Candidatus Geothermarchaeota archaeon]|nr:MAG: DUF4145 domain-containing protein [Candidatus Geothermarchaeota archaeon]